MSDTPTSAADILGVSGTPVFITYKDQQHPISPPVATVLDLVEQTVARRALAAIRKDAEFMPPEWTAGQEKDLGAMMRQREHATGGTLWAAEMGADGGMRGLQLVLWASLEDARNRTKDKTTLPPAIPFDDIPAVLEESPDAGAVANLLLPDFFRAAGKRRKMPAAVVEKAIAKIKPVV